MSELGVDPEHPDALNNHPEAQAWIDQMAKTYGLDFGNVYLDGEKAVLSLCAQGVDALFSGGRRLRIPIETMGKIAEFTALYIEVENGRRS